MTFGGQSLSSPHWTNGHPGQALQREPLGPPSQCPLSGTFTIPPTQIGHGCQPGVDEDMSDPVRWILTSIGTRVNVLPVAQSTPPVASWDITVPRHVLTVGLSLSRLAT